MSQSLKEISRPIEKELLVFQEKFKDSMKSQVPLMDVVMNYILKTKGKQIRPVFVLLSSKLSGGVGEASFHAASLVELLHTATLVHDDVVDDSLERRGFFSINALWKNKIAVLVGDYLLSKGLLLALDNNQHRLLQILSNAVREMSEGELLQIEKARKLDIEEPVYFDIITKKTASLIAAACAAGAAAGGGTPEQVELMRKFGESAGIAFQIRDDLFDFGFGDAGKPQMNDLKERKMTLPLIFALNNADKAKRSKMINVVKKHNTDTEKIVELVTWVNQSGGVEYAKAKMEEYCKLAFDALAQFPDSDAKKALHDLVVFVTTRDK